MTWHLSHADIVGCIVAALPPDLGRTRTIVSLSSYLSRLTVFLIPVLYTYQLCYDLFTSIWTHSDKIIYQIRFTFQVASQIVSQGLVDSRKALHKKTKNNKVAPPTNTSAHTPLIVSLTKQKPWTEEEIYTLQSLWQPDRDVDDVIKELQHYFPGTMSIT